GHVGGRRGDPRDARRRAPRADLGAPLRRQGARGRARAPCRAPRRGGLAQLGSDRDPLRRRRGRPRRGVARSGGGEGGGPGGRRAGGAVIRLEQVSRAFQVGETVVHALADVSEHVAPGEHVAIMGPSGSGKSTLMNVVGYLDRPTSGAYFLDGREVSRLDDAELTEVRRHLIGFVFQAFHLVPRLTAAENVELPM